MQVRICNDFLSKASIVHCRKICGLYRCDKTLECSTGRFRPLTFARGGAAHSCHIPPSSLSSEASGDRSTNQARKTASGAVCAPIFLFQIASRLAIFAIVARLHPVAAWIPVQDMPLVSMSAIAALRFVSSRRPVYRPSAFAFA